MNSYQTALQQALLSGFYVPELMDCYFRHNGFHSPKFFVHDMH